MGLKKTSHCQICIATFKYNSSCWKLSHQPNVEKIRLRHQNIITNWCICNSSGYLSLKEKFFMQIGSAEEWSRGAIDTNGADIGGCIDVSVILMHDLPSLLKLFSHPSTRQGLHLMESKYSCFSNPWLCIHVAVTLKLIGCDDRITPSL